jgi:hypothetical protein
VTYGGDAATLDALRGSGSVSESLASGGVEGGLPSIELSVDDDGPVAPSTSIVPSQKLPSRCR